MGQVSPLRPCAKSHGWRHSSRCFAFARARRIAGPIPFVISAALTIAVGVWVQPGETVMGSSSVQVLDAEYTPHDGEPFMNERQLEYFKNKLLMWKDDILRESRETVSHLQSETENHPDLADRASSETDRSLELRTRDRQRKLIAKIDEALRRIEDGAYGYCEETGEPIGLARLQARPIATLGLEAQERHERRERVHRDD
jgi:DnaK suppressor protein